MSSKHNRHIALIANLTSQNKTNQSSFDKYVIEYLEDNKIEISFYATNNILELKLAIKNAYKKGIYEFVTIGGDGSFHHLINELFILSIDYNIEYNFKTGLIPFGTGNDYIRNFNSSSTASLLNAIVNNQIKHVDIGQIVDSNNPSKLFANMIGIGFSGEVVQRVNKYKFLGKFSYYLALFDAFFTYKPLKIELVVNDQKIFKNCFQLSIGIGKYAGGSMNLCPNAEIDDGYFDINFIEEINLGKFIRYIYTLKDGTYLDKLKVYSFKTSYVEIMNSSGLLIEADGEPINKDISSIFLLKCQLQFFNQ